MNVQASTTRKLYIAGFCVATLKLLISGWQVWGLKQSDFTGGDFATVVGALGLVYWGRRHTDNNVPKS